MDFQIELESPILSRFPIPFFFFFGGTQVALLGKGLWRREEVANWFHVI